MLYKQWAGYWGNICVSGAYGLPSVLLPTVAIKVTTVVVPSGCHILFGWVGACLLFWWVGVCFTCLNAAQPAQFFDVMDIQVAHTMKIGIWVPHVDTVL